MLVIISDLHLTDGTSGATISSGAFEIFAEALGELAESASWRAGGAYRPVSRVDLVLLGDVLDLIRSTRWLRGTSLRPWSHLNTPDAAAFLAATTGEILAHNEPSLRIFRRLAEGGVTLPSATSAGKPAPEAPFPVPVHIHYLVGNHDWFYHLPGAIHNGMRQAVIRSMGLANRADVPFPHDPAESDELTDLFRSHRLFARHGDVFDPFNFMGARDASSLGDAIVIELLDRFAHEIASELGDDISPAAVAGFRELDNLRPLLLAPVWIEGLLERTCPRPSVRAQVKRVWDRLADDFLDLEFVRAQDTWSPIDVVDGLQRALRFSQQLSLGRASSIVSWLTKLRGSDEESYHKHAIAEPEFRNRRARHIVYGHTHFPESVPLDASFADGQVLNQMYFNSGTWRRVHRQTRLAPAEHEFIASECMTWLSFFHADERKGRPYETWSGMLAVPPAEVPSSRIDRVVPRHERQSVSASGLPGHGPHFATPLARPVAMPARRLP